MHAYYLGCAVLLFQITGSTYINIENKLTFTEKGTPQKTNLVAEVTVRRSSVPRFFFLAFFFACRCFFSHVDFHPSFFYPVLPSWGIFSSWYFHPRSIPLRCIPHLRVFSPKSFSSRIFFLCLSIIMYSPARFFICTSLFPLMKCIGQHMS